jgi:hypothetical protein
MSTVAQDLRSSFFAAATIAVLVVLPGLGVASAEPLALSEPPNVGDAKFAATAYYKSGAYERDLSAVASRVGARLAERAPQVSRAALVLDIDDTVLSNWEVIVADDFGRVFDGPCRSLPNGPCGWVAWDLRARTPAIEQMLAFSSKRVHWASQCSSFPDGMSGNATQPSRIFARWVLRAIGDFTWKRTAPVTHPPPISRRRCASGSKRTGIRSLPMSAISRPTWPVVTRR